MDDNIEGGLTTGAARSSEAGFTLIELLMAMVVMGIAFVGLLAAMGTSISASGLHRTQAVAELEVRRYAELVAAPTATYAETYTASGVGYVPPADEPFVFVAGPIEVSHRNAAGGVSDFLSSRHQIIKVSVQSEDGRVDEWVEIVKRRS